ncbi:MAG: DUF4838 domain-containing protein [Kiritimatiellaeota bacterium]|nr:DUF4838 domain-containing protein [Kiritimatiellota bacterium]
MKRWVVLLGCVAGLAGVSTAQGPLAIAVRGQAAGHVIVRPAAASPSQVYAAEELQKFVGQLTGVTLAIQTDEGALPERAVLLGNTRHTDAVLGAPADVGALGDDGFRLVTRGNHLLVLGGPVRGTLYGVYEVLERFGGCRWYASWHSVIPSLDRLEVPALDEAQRPAFALREPYWFDMFKGDFAARNKVNGNAPSLTERHGGKIRFGGGMFVHTFEKLCPSEEFFDTHPEYFSEIGGTRVKAHTQLCLTNPDVLRIVTERTLAAIRKDPGAKLFSVSQNDWYNGCTCANCKAIDDREGTQAGSLIAFVNKVAAAVEREFPDVWIETLAYQYTRTPPKTVRPRRNVVPRLCTIECDFSHALDVSAFKQNRKFVEDINGWSALTDKLYIWDYVTDFRNYIGPFPNINALQGNVRFFKANNVVGLFEQGAYQGRHGEFAELKAWLLAKWLWNPDLPQDALVSDFLNGYYGAAAPFVRQYIDKLHAQYTDPENTPLSIFVDVMNLNLADGFLPEALALWQQAEAAVKGSPAHLYNVRMSAIPALFAHLARNFGAAEIKVWCMANPRDRLNADAQRTAQDLLSRLDEAKDIRLSEPPEHHDSILRGWKSLANPNIPERGQTKALIGHDLLTLSRRGEWGDTVPDPLATGDTALKLFNTHYEWCATLHMRHVAFDPGKRYKIRARLRFDKIPGKEGKAVWAGVYDTKAKKSNGDISRTTTQVSEDYAWYDIAEFTPNTDQYFWIGPGMFDKAKGETSAINALYIDQIELSVAP